MLFVVVQPTSLSPQSLPLSLYLIISHIDRLQRLFDSVLETERNPRRSDLKSLLNTLKEQQEAIEQLLHSRSMAIKLVKSELEKQQPTPVYGVSEYKFRSECRADVDEFLELFQDQIIDYNVTRTEFSDCEVEFSSKLHIDCLRLGMYDIPDGHVMLESLNYASEYTGERYYDVDL